MKEIRITNNEEGQRLDRFLKKYLNKANQSFIQKMIRKKNIKLNDTKTEPDTLLKKDDIIMLYLSDDTIEKFREKKSLLQTEIHFKTVYEDDNILIVNKPIGLSSQPDETSSINLVDEIKTYLDAKEENISFTFKPAVCNRLDKNTSGLVIAAKNYDALKQTNKAIRERSIKKLYMAKVHGIINEDLELKDYLIKDEYKNMVQIVKEYTENAKEVVTYAHPVRKEGNYTWVEVEIETGRAHQIRAHLASIGHPVAGDKKYGRKDSEKQQVLHAYKLVLGGYEDKLDYLNGLEVKSEISDRILLKKGGFMKIELINENKIIEIGENESLFDFLKKHKTDYSKYLGIKVNNKLQDLINAEYKENDKIEYLSIKDRDGHRIYVRTLTLIYIKACKDIFEDIVVEIKHSLNKGLYTELEFNQLVNKSQLENIKNRMHEIINAKRPINTMFLSIEEAEKIFLKQGMNDKIELLKYWTEDNIRVYELDGYYDTFYGYLAPNTEFIDKFDLRLFFPGIILNYPTRENNFEVPEYIEQKKLFKVFKEAEDWGKIMDVGYVGALNKKITNNTIDDMIRINEALHEKKIAYIADEISNDKNIKIVLIAGPSSSGKTTFAQRLSIQLRVNGKKTFALSLDDYFVDRHLTPKDENGDIDFETIDALDLELFNEQLLSLMSCDSVNIPVYNFKLGKREYTREPVKLTKDHIIIIEGIHGLNDQLTTQIPQINKFKIYISALTQLNIDNHNRISTSDLRLLRRLVRDNTHRGNNALKTMELWDNVVRGAERYIFPFQENADAIFNSALVYELCVLKKYAEPLIREISKESKFYPERQRLLKFLSYFKTIENESAIPNTSILREFIGESCFE